jgi:hypothetical protein
MFKAKLLDFRKGVDQLIRLPSKATNVNRGSKNAHQASVPPKYDRKYSGSNTAPQSGEEDCRIKGL